MAKSNQFPRKRKIAQAVLHLNSAAENLIPLEMEFRPVHPELADFLAQTLHGISLMLLLINEFSDRTWGGHPEDYETWRAE